VSWADSRREGRFAILRIGLCKIKAALVKSQGVDAFGDWSALIAGVTSRRRPQAHCKKGGKFLDEALVISVRCFIRPIIVLFVSPSAEPSQRRRDAYDRPSHPRSRPETATIRDKDGAPRAWIAVGVTTAVPFTARSRA